MSAKGHQDAFPRPRLSGRNRFGQASFMGTRGNGRDAPIPVVRDTTMELEGLTLSSHSLTFCPERTGRSLRDPKRFDSVAFKRSDPALSRLKVDAKRGIMRPEHWARSST